MVQSINWQKLTDEERALAQFVQGILNRKGKKIFIDRPARRALGAC